MARFNLDDYIDVNERIQLFYEKYPAGKIYSDLINVSHEHEGQKQTQFIVKAYLYDGEQLLATGLAEESFSTNGANVTSPLENAETSAIGRACQNLGMKVMRNGKPEPRASRQEMEKVQRGTNVQQLTPQQTILRETITAWSGDPVERKNFMEMVLDRQVLGYHDVLNDEVDEVIKALAEVSSK